MDKFIPSDELVSFATEFAFEYKELATGEYGHYMSAWRNYTIRYLDILPYNVGDRRIVNSVGRICSKTGIMELQKSVLTGHLDFTKHFVFYVILWLRCYYELFKEGKSDLMKTDLLTLEYYFTTDRPKKDIYYGLNKQMELAKSEQNLERCKAIVKSFHDFFPDFFKQKNEI